jgi:hypothetical protein
LVIITNTVIAGVERIPEIETIVFIDYAAPTSGPYSMACPAYDNENETDTYHFTRGGIRWFDFPVTYRVIGVSESEVEVAFDEWDHYDPIENFFSSNNFSVNTVSFSEIDGEGDAIATAIIWYYPHNKTIVGFKIILDEAEPWGIGESGKFDIRNVVTHEVGHVVGLDHVNSPKDCWLTMYKYTLPGETSKRTLGLGDRSGIVELYTTSLFSIFFKILGN